MADRPLPDQLPADLPEDWTSGQIVAPEGADAGLSEQHGYNYQSKQINNAQRAINQIRDVLESGDIENAVTVSGGGHMTMVGSLGDPPYEITVTEETDEPLTAEDVGAIPLPENPVKGQALIFNGSKWVPGNVASDLPIASSATLGGIMVGDGLEISKTGTLSWDKSYIRAGKISGNFSSGSTNINIVFIMYARYPLMILKITLMNSSSAASDLTISVRRDATGSESVAATQSGISPNTGFETQLVGVLGKYNAYNFVGNFDGYGDTIKLSSSAGSGEYTIEVVGIGPKIN